MDSLVEKFRNALVARQFDGVRDIAMEVMCLEQPSPLFAAIAALHPDECDLVAVLDAAPEDLTRLAMSSLLPSLGQAQGFRLADAYQLLILANLVNSSVIHQIIVCLGTQLQCRVDLVERLSMDFAQGKIEGAVAQQVFAGALARSSQTAAARLAADMFEARGSLELVAKLVICLDGGAPDVAQELLAHQLALATALELLARERPTDPTAWQALFTISHFSEAAMQVVQRVLKDGPVHGLKAIAGWLTCMPAAMVGPASTPVLDIVQPIIVWTVKEPTLKHAVDSMLWRLFHQEDTRQAARTAFLQLALLADDTDLEFPEAIEALVALSADFAYVLTQLLVIPGGSSTWLRKLFTHFTLNQHLVNLDFAVFQGADETGKIRAIRRLLAFIHNGPFICQLAALFAENESIQPAGIQIANEMFNYIKDEFPAATESFLKSKIPLHNKKSPAAVLYRGVYAKVLHWKRILQQLPRLSELQPSESQMFTLRRYKQHEHREIMRGVAKRSILSQLATPIHIAQGNRYATQTYQNGMQISKFNQVSTSFELPSSELADPVGGLLRRIHMVVLAK